MKTAPHRQICRAKAIAARCSDAYDADRYASWNGVALELVRRGYADRPVEAIMRSKWMRWAAEARTARYGRVSAKAITEWMDVAFKAGGEREKVYELTLELFDVGRSRPQHYTPKY